MCVYAWIRLKPYVIIYTIESILYSLFEEFFFFFHVVQFLPEVHVTAQGQCSGYGNIVTDSREEEEGKKLWLF